MCVRIPTSFLAGCQIFDGVCFLLTCLIIRRADLEFAAKKPELDMFGEKKEGPPPELSPLVEGTPVEKVEGWDYKDVRCPRLRPRLLLGQWRWPQCGQDHKHALHAARVM